MNVAFLDRDGTIIKDYPDKEWINVKYPEFLEGAIETLQYIKNIGFEIIIITNQYLIGEGIITLGDYQQFNDLFLKVLNENRVHIRDIFYCPHARSQHCNCIKPNPDLINQALFKYPDIDLKKSFYVGDSCCDMRLAKKFNLTFYGINVPCKNKIRSLNDVINLL